MVSENILNSNEVILALTLKTNQLKREELKSLTYQQVVQTLTDFVWQNKVVKTMNEAVNDIMRLDASLVVAYLSSDAIKRGAKLRLEDINEILKGDLNG